MVKISKIGENAFLKQLFSEGHVHGGKDDCVVLRIGKNNVLISTDSVSYSTNLPAESTPSQIGAFLASINLSDIAAMAGKPIGLLGSFIVPPSTEDRFLYEIVEAIDLKMKEFGSEYLGGDTKEGAELVLAGTAIGEQKDSVLRRRSDLKKGQILCVTGKQGRAASGYIFYRSGYRKRQGIDLLLNFTPRIREAQIISEYGGKFMTDLSDGIASAIAKAKDDFNIGFRIVQNEIGLDRNVSRAILLSGASDLDLSLYFGGDYELMFTIENDNYRDFKDAMEKNRIDVSFIGDSWEGENIIFDGEKWTTINRAGYEHFREPPKLGKIV